MPFCKMKSEGELEKKFANEVDLFWAIVCFVCRNYVILRQ